MSLLNFEIENLFTFIASIIGDLGEVILHDLRNDECSITKIHNGHITGREVGPSPTEFGLKAIKSGNQASAPSYIPPHRTHSSSGRVLKSSSLFFRDENNELAYVLCVNLNVGNIVEVNKILESLTIFNNIESNTEPEYSLKYSSKDAVMDTITEFVTKKKYNLNALTSEEKKQIVNNADENGVFLMKGTISTVAEILSVSEPTVYRYLSEIRKEK